MTAFPKGQRLVISRELSVIVFVALAGAEMLGFDISHISGRLKSAVVPEAEIVTVTEVVTNTVKEIEERYFVATKDGKIVEFTEEDLK